MSDKIVEATRADALKIRNAAGHSLNNLAPLSVQLPVNLIFAADVLLREMCMRGNTSAELTIKRGVNPTGESCWLATWGGWTCWNSTPWGAVERLGRAVETFLYGEAP